MILKLWYWLVGGCQHKWKTLYVVKGGTLSYVISECNKCGKINKVKLEYCASGKWKKVNTSDFGAFMEDLMK